MHLWAYRFFSTRWLLEGYENRCQILNPVQCTLCTQNLDLKKVAITTCTCLTFLMQLELDLHCPQILLVTEFIAGFSLTFNSNHSFKLIVCNLRDKLQMYPNFCKIVGKKKEVKSQYMHNKARKRTGVVINFLFCNWPWDHSCLWHCLSPFHITFDIR